MKLSTFIQKYQTLIAIGLIAGLGYWYFTTNPQALQGIQNLLPAFNPNINVNMPTSPAQSNNPQQSPASNNLAPTSLSVQVSPNPANMGGAVYGSVTSNGYNMPITVYAKNLGAEEWTNQGTQSFGALLGANGQYQHLQQMNVPGYWQFWVTCGSVTSNVASLTVIGVMVSCDRSTTSDTATFTIFSNRGNSAVQLFANDPAHSVSIPLQTGNTDSTGSISLMYNFATIAPGIYEIDAVVGGESASTWGGTWQLEVT